MPVARPVAAIDCGTNSTRLLIVDVAGATLERRMRITRLGHGVDRTGRLDEEAIARVVDALTEYRSLADQHGVGAIRMAATSAARDASNSAVFFDAAEEVLGVRPELLSGAEEGRLSFRGATSGGRLEQVPTLVIDLGGGSTELAYGVPGSDPTTSISLDVGCVRLTEKHLEHDPPQPEELANAIGEVRGLLEDVERDHPELADVQQVVGLAGTISTVAMLEQGLTDYDRSKVDGFVITREMAEEWFREMAMVDREQRLHHPGLEEQRADVIVGGLCVLVGLIRQWSIESMVHSESDILDGLAASLLAQG